MLHADLVTFHFAHHYGAQLQAYATMAAIRAMGMACEIIDYRLPHTTRTNGLFKKSGALRDVAADAHTALHYAAFKRRFNRFEAFVSDHMPLSAQRYTSFDRLNADPPRCDVYVAGSDQIWNPFIYENQRFDPAFLLAFAGETRRIAYAPSLGVSHLPEERAAELKDYLAPFSALSARERRGSDLIAAITGRAPRVVLDPTLLLTGDDWGKLAVPPARQGEYILCYFVSDPGEVAPYAKALAERTGLPIVQLAGARRKIPGASEVVFDAGPKEFLGFFQNAAYVCTNSFHGAVFSVQFGRPFFTSMSPKERAEPTFSRIYSLLDRIGCSHRIVGLETTAPVDAPVDYDEVNRRLAAARADSLAYFRAALEGAPLPADATAAAEPAKDKGPTLCSPAACTGCTACASICPVNAISMKRDREGFLRPNIGDTCTHCLRCEAVCPALAPPSGELTETPVYAAQHRDSGVLQASTSGGLFTALARYVFDRGGVVFGAAFDENLHVAHRSAETAEALAPLRQTKYVQSDLTAVFPAVAAALNSGRTVLFSGTPCQVDGLRHYLGDDRENLLTCDLVCHGVPSPAVYEQWLRAEEVRHGKKAAKLLFRDKSARWNKPKLTLTFDDGSVHTAPLSETPFGRGFGGALFLRPSCAQCPCAGRRRPGDFTLGDFWGLADGAIPAEQRDGVSLVLLNSDKAAALWPILSDGLAAVPRPWSEAVAGNPRLLTPVSFHPKRAAFFASFTARPFEQTMQDFLALPSLSYRLAAKVLTPGMKARLRKLLK